VLQLSFASHCSPEEQSIPTEMQSSGLMNCVGCRRCPFWYYMLTRFGESSEPTAEPLHRSRQGDRFHCAIGYEVILVPVLICIFVKAGTIPACKVTRFRSASSHVSLEHKAARRIARLSRPFSSSLRGGNTADGVRNFVFGSSVATWKRIEPAFAFPAAVATVERPGDTGLLRCIWISSKVWLEINGFAETEVVRLGAGFFRKPRQVGLGIESAERTASTPGHRGA